MVKDIAKCHVLHHNAHYIRSVLRQCGISTDVGEAWRPELDHIGSGVDACRRFGVEPGEYVAWQPCSDNRRKDYPPGRWAETIHAFPEMPFVALVEPGRADEVSRTTPPGVRVIETSLTMVMKLIREARLFVGLDSGLSHIATVMGTPTVCVCPDSHLGYFFPYPESYGFKNLYTVAHPDYLSCRGCFMTCRHEPLTSTVTRGALCLRTLPSPLVIEAIRSAL
ncbi:MAG: glycosyltransferase family 9 protein [Gemmatimonadetes bacterium]|nr:glycosyltransferase family 9 protein [Gemmatimonadota bacterium]